MDEGMTGEKKKILHCIVNYPGQYLSKIAEIVGLPLDIVSRNLEELEASNLIIIEKSDKLYRYYALDSSGDMYQRKISEIRKRIYTIVSENPGVYLSQIAEMLAMRISHVEYHLSYLEKSEMIVGSKERGYKRYYVKGAEIGVVDRQILALLRQELPLKIVLLLLKNEKLTHKALLEHFPIAPSTLSYHLGKLLNSGVLDLVTYGDEKGYVIKNKRAVLNFFTKYKLEKMVKSYTDLWTDLKYTH
jgi:predicted transcriptional regulator